MMQTRLSALVLLLGIALGCSPRDSVSGAESFKSLLEDSDRYASVQDYERAADYAIRALDVARGPEKAEALTHLARIDLMTWRDGQAWEHICEAERIARSSSSDSLLCAALIQKGRLCSYSGITEESARDDEALGYFNDALAIASARGYHPEEIDIYYNLSQVCVNRNRFRDPIDEDIYRQAGEYLEKGRALALEHGLNDLYVKALPYQIRYLRQGGKTEDGIECCKENLEHCGEQDYLMRSQILNQLVMMYAARGLVEEAADAHQQYTIAVQSYLKQRSDTLLQDMETRYESRLKQTRIDGLKILVVMLSIMLLLLALAALQFVIYNRRLLAASHNKDKLIRFISKDFTSSSFHQEVASKLPDFSSMDDAQIRQRCSELFGDSAQLSQEVADYIVTLVRERDEAGSHFGLTPRELEIVRLSGEGLSALRIADRLNISVYTVNKHKQNIYAKMNVRNNAGMLKAASEAGII